MARAARPRDRHARTPEGPAHALSPRPRPAAGPASSPSSYLSGLAGRAAACLLAAGLVLLLGAGAAEAQAPVSFVSDGQCIGTTDLSACPHAPTGYADGGPGENQITVVWTPATTGATATAWAVLERPLGNDDFGIHSTRDADVRRYTIPTLLQASIYDIGIAGKNGTTIFGTRGLAKRVTVGPTPPTFVSAAVNAKTLTVTFNEDLDTGSEPSSTRFIVRARGTRIQVSSTGVAIAGKVVTLTLESAVTDTDTVEVSYSSTITNPLQDLVGNDVANFGPRRVTNNTPDTTPPAFSSATVNRTMLKVTFNETLDTGSVPPLSAFTVKANGLLVALPTTPHVIAGKTVTITLPSTVTPTDTVSVAYTKPATNPLQDPAGNDVETFSDRSVTNQTGTPPVLSSARVSWDTLTMTFDRTLDATKRPAGGSFFVWMDRYVSEPGGELTRCGQPGKCWFQTPGKGTATVSGATVTVRLTRFIPPGATVGLSYVPPQTNALADTFGTQVPRLRDFENIQAVDDGSVPAYTDPAPVFRSAKVNGRTLTVTFGEELDPDSAPAGSAFTVSGMHGGGIRTGTGTASIAGRTATVTLDLAVVKGDPVSVSYARPASGNRLRDLAGNAVETFTGKRLANNTPHAAPEFVSAAIRQGASQYLSINFTNALDEDSEPAGSAFTVRETKNGRTRTIRGTGTVNVTGSPVHVKLARAVEPGATVTLSYRKPSANPLIDREGLAVESFSNKGVSNGAPSIDSVAIVSNPGSDRTYERGDTIRVQVTFTEPVIVDTRRGTPRLKLNQGNSHWQKSDTRGGFYYPWADYESGNRTPTLTFAYTVKSLDRSDGIAVTDQLELNGGRIRSVWAWPVRDAELPDPQYYPQHWLDYDRNHKVDGRVGRPKFVSAVADGATLTVTFDETLDTGYVPAPGAFRVTVNGVRRDVVSGGVAIDRATVRLTLISPVARADAVKVRYVQQRTNGLRNAAGYLVENFPDQAVTNDTSIWSATLTANSAGSGSRNGCTDAGGPDWHCTSRLTDNSFAHADTTRQVTGVELLFLSNTESRLLLTLDEAISRDWTLHVDRHQFPLADARISNSGNTAIWSNPGLTWKLNQKVKLRLTESSGGGGAVGNAAPGFRSASVSGNKLKVTYDEPLDEGSTPPGNSFRVRTMPDGGAVGNGARGKRSAASGGGPGNIGGTGTASIDGATVTVTLDRPVAPGERLVVSYNRPGENAIRDPAGAERRASPGARRPTSRRRRR